MARGGAKFEFELESPDPHYYPFMARTAYDMDITHYAFYQQVCDLQFTSWEYPKTSSN
jgi:hypothetical protein